jgi:hypothetical protein
MHRQRHLPFIPSARPSSSVESPKTMTYPKNTSPSGRNPSAISASL